VIVEFRGSDRYRVMPMLGNKHTEVVATTATRPRRAACCKPEPGGVSRNKARTLLASMDSDEEKPMVSGEFLLARNHQRTSFTRHSA